MKLQSNRRTLPAYSTKDDAYTSVGACIGGVVALLLARRFHLHGEILLLLIGAIGIACGFALGLSLFNYLYEKADWKPGDIFR